MKLKTQSEIESMKRGGAILAKALKAAVQKVQPGVLISDLDKAAEESMRKDGAKPSFLNYCQIAGQPGFPSTLCISVNEEVIHGPANREIRLKEGDIVGLDIGCWYEGFATDMAVTVPVGKVDKEKSELIARTKESLKKALAVVKNGASIRSVGQAITKYLEPFGYGIVRDYVGHGVGDKLHEEPSIPNYDEPSYEKKKFKSGMTIAIEPMIIMGGDSRVEILDDDWTVVSRDRSPAAHFEVTLAVTDDGYELVTPWVA